MTSNKMKRRLAGGQTLLLATLLLGSATSCFDDSYDLKKDIDMTINVGGEHLAFPVGSTEKITLDKIIEIEEGDDLQTDANGAYHLLKSGEIDDITTDVKTITVKATDTKIDPIEVANSTDFSGGNLTTETTNEKSKPIETSADDIDEAVKEIYSLTTSTPIKIILEKGGEMNLAELDATVTIQFSPVMQVEGADENNRITFPLNERDLSEGSYEHEVNLTGFVFGDGNKGNGKVIGEDHRIDISEEVTVTVDAKVTVSSVQAGDELTLTPTIHIEDMTITEASGIVEPSLDESTSSMELNNLPDFLENEETQLDITNPIFTFHAYNPLDIDVEITGTLSGMKNGTLINGSEVQIGGENTERIILHPGDNTISLSRLGNGGPEESQNIKVEDLNNLIQTIPDKVNVTIQPTVICDDYFSIKLGSTYTVDCNYDIDVPLSFGSGLNIVYEETIDDLGGDMEDFDIYEAMLTASVDNTIPLAMELTNDNVEVLDGAGQKIESVTVSVTGDIKAGDGTEQPVNSQLDINLKTTEKGVLNRLDAIRLKITAKSGTTTDKQLYESQWIQLKDIKLKLPKGVTVDMN